MMKSGQRSTYLLVESIGCWDGDYPYLPFHQQRLDSTMKQLFPGAKAHDLRSILKNIDLPKGLNKIRFLYDEEDYQIEILPYERRMIRHLQIMKSDDISYSLKYVERPELEKLYQKRGEADEILIFKSGLLTDAYYANVVCVLEGRLYTPATPLLKGVMREYLIEKGQVELKDIDLKTLQKCDGVILVNALNPITTAPFISKKYIFS